MLTKRSQKNKQLFFVSARTNKRHHHQRMQNWCKFIVQSPHHKGGYAITRLDSRIWPGSILFGYR